MELKVLSCGLTQELVQIALKLQIVTCLLEHTTSILDGAHICHDETR